MELRQLSYFVAVAEERHFGRAAERLSMAQPPLSQQIKALEKRLGVTLLRRTTRRVDLTPAGEFLLDRARVLLSEAESLRRDLRRIDDGVQGVLRMGVTGTAAYEMLPAVLRTAGQDLPGLELEVQGESLTPEVVADLLDHRLDLALLRFPVASTELELEVVRSDPLVVALPEHHEFAAADEIRWDMLRGRPMVSYPAGSALASITAELCRAAGFQPTVAQVVRETSTIVAIVAGGGGAAVVPAQASALGLPGVVYRPVAGAPTVDLAMAWRPGDERPLMGALRDIVRRCAGTADTT